MKSITSYCFENENTALLFENAINSSMTLQECFEAIGDEMLRMNEGIFSKIGKALQSWGKKAADAGEAADKKIDALSSDIKDAATSAIEATKKKAGKAWDNMKDAYTAVVADVATGIDSAKETITAVAKQTGKKVSDITATVSTIVSNGIANGSEKIKAALATPAKMAAMVCLVGAAQACQKHGLDILDVLTAAGIN